MYKLEDQARNLDMSQVVGLASKSTTEGRLRKSFTRQEQEIRKICEDHELSIAGKHISHDGDGGIGNCRSNLRACTQQQNTQNRRLSSWNKTGFKGVMLIRETEK